MWNSVALNLYLKALVDDLKLSAESSIQLTISTESVELDPDRVVAIGIIVSELVINALKYAYPDNKGSIRVVLAQKGKDDAVVSVEDDGIGFNGSMTFRGTGLGQTIVKAMADKLGAVVTHDAVHRGTKIEIDFPIARSKRTPLGS